MFFFFFKQKTAYEMRISDWSSDVCSSDLAEVQAVEDQEADDPEHHRLRLPAEESGEHPRTHALVGPAQRVRRGTGLVGNLFVGVLSGGLRRRAGRRRGGERPPGREARTIVGEPRAQTEGVGRE